MNARPITWGYSCDDILAMEDECAACGRHDESCKTCTIARIISECYANELRDEGVDASVDDAFGMLFE